MCDVTVKPLSPQLSNTVASPNLLSYSPLLLSSPTLLSYSPLLLSSPALPSCSPLLLSPPALPSCSPLLLSSPALLSCSPALLSYSPLLLRPKSPSLKGILENASTHISGCSSGCCSLFLFIPQISPYRRPLFLYKNRLQCSQEKWLW